MSELKSYMVYTPREGVVAGFCKSCSIRIEEGAEIYLKSEADKVVEEKDKEIAKLKIENESLKKTLQHSEDELESYFIFEKEIKQELRVTHKALCLLRAENAENRIAFFDKDETYSPDYVEERVGFWEKVKNYWQAKAEEYK